ncbi:hypothetical protein CCB80_03200 [Armatimonadetes bacterium Uphvl-Ar1]|nr:hypothetical protein CCB80_03200 [Armatimonadetes bacterium Uphvl-Ar1]
MNILNPEYSQAGLVFVPKGAVAQPKPIGGNYGSGIPGPIWVNPGDMLYIQQIDSGAGNPDNGFRGEPED